MEGSVPVPSARYGIIRNQTRIPSGAVLPQILAVDRLQLIGQEERWLPGPRNPERQE